MDIENLGYRQLCHLKSELIKIYIQQELPMDHPINKDIKFLSDTISAIESCQVIYEKYKTTEFVK